MTSRKKGEKINKKNNFVKSSLEEDARANTEVELHDVLWSHVREGGS